MKTVIEAFGHADLSLLMAALHDDVVWKSAATARGHPFRLVVNTSVATASRNCCRFSPLNISLSYARRRRSSPAVTSCGGYSMRVQPTTLPARLDCSAV